MIFCDFQTLFNNHPYHTIQYAGMGGQIEKYIDTKVETCTIELSYAMNRSGLNIPDDLPYSPIVAGGRVRSMKDERGDNYIYSVVDMKAYLDKTYPLTQNYRAGSRAGFVKQLGSRKGILALGYRHISLWDGKHYVHETDFFDLWSGEHAVSTALRGVFFWEIASLSSVFDDALGQ
ncbi:T6SS effector amidase Tae4 family protein [Dyadobacter frigoris]|uniref:Uncharacterized protein n=1 Tax=Dyadobacter frigoris TaxID=2576211 RepID=A0A4U6CYQ9_9BACT|nr:T6SS effector amidase Tae4 family protein [Dyadobacter frigoris]TKT88937.1 hypothetical protein FDK13_25240 [Dyadobacter frigoris]GLU56962.1 hypothetical protein Dfri01_64230 [Dyadobacter frigoris]